MSQLEKVTILNFRNTGERVIDVKTQPCIIEGLNMSGKTNTLNAIHWAFTGTTLDGSNNNRDNFTISNGPDAFCKFSVKLDFGDFIFERMCELIDGTPTESIFVDGTKFSTVKAGMALLYNKLGLIDLVLTKKGKFDIVKFLLNPLYFETCAPKDLRRFFYDLADLDFDAIASQQSMAVFNAINGSDTKDPYELLDSAAKEKKAIKDKITTCKNARALFPSIEEESKKKEKELAKELKEAESKESLIEKYASNVSKRANAYFKKAMGITVCLLEEGVGDGVVKDVCYPLLPESGLPFSQGSYAERTYVGVKFIQEVSKKLNIHSLPMLVDNMESLDAHTSSILNSLNTPYIGAKVTQ